MHRQNCCGMRSLRSMCRIPPDNQRTFVTKPKPMIWIGRISSRKCLCSFNLLPIMRILPHAYSLPCVLLPMRTRSHAYSCQCVLAPMRIFPHAYALPCVLFPMRNANYHALWELHIIDSSVQALIVCTEALLQDIFLRASWH